MVHKLLLKVCLLFLDPRGGFPGCHSDALSHILRKREGEGKEGGEGALIFEQLHFRFNPPPHSLSGGLLGEKWVMNSAIGREEDGQQWKTF